MDRWGPPCGCASSAATLRPPGQVWVPSPQQSWSPASGCPAALTAGLGALLLPPHLVLPCPRQSVCKCSLTGWRAGPTPPLPTRSSFPFHFLPPPDSSFFLMSRTWVTKVLPRAWRSLQVPQVRICGKTTERRECCLLQLCTWI